MFKLFGRALWCLRSLARDKSDLVLENMALRHQLLLLQRQSKQPKSKPTDRLLWSLLSRYWPGWKHSLLLFRPETVIGWQKAAFRWYWRWRSRPQGGRPRIHSEVAQLIRRMWEANPTWGAPRIRDELAKLGLPVATATVRKYRCGWQKPHQGRKVLIRSVKATSFWGHVQAVLLGAFVSAIAGSGQVGFGFGKHGLAAPTSPAPASVHEAKFKPTDRLL